MPIHFLNNYPENSLDKFILNSESNQPLYGEIWVYQQFVDFEKNKFLNETENWYLYHSYNLSIHPGSSHKVTGEVDFVLLTPQGVIVIEVKGGKVSLKDGNFISSKGEDSYQTQNPFIQADDYGRSFKTILSGPQIFTAKAVVFPHTRDLSLTNPILEGYKHCLFQASDIIGESEYKKNESFFVFINDLLKKTKRYNLSNLKSNWSKEFINKEVDKLYPALNNKEMKRIKGILFPSNQSYLKDLKIDLAQNIYRENYAILLGLGKNRNVMIQGGPGTGKTIIALNFIKENSLSEKRGVFFCANLFVRAYLRHIILEEYKIDSSLIQFRIFSEVTDINSFKNENIDYFVFDEAQEYFSKGLYEFIEASSKIHNEPKNFLLYDTNQTILNDVTSYEDYLIYDGFSHYYFDKNYRCIQELSIVEVSDSILLNSFNSLANILRDSLKIISKSNFNTEQEYIIEIYKQFSSFLNNKDFLNNQKIILVCNKVNDNGVLLDKFKTWIMEMFNDSVEELTESNINQPTTKIRYTTALKYRGLEKESVLVISDELSTRTKTQLYVGVTRAMQKIEIVIWE